ncbi:MAG: geranylgeranylglycerol-phosphate geranylgeranyltransferase [Bacteroidales bacterium]
MMHYLRLVRWPNLLITILTMFLVRYYLIRPSLLTEGIDLQMPLSWFIALVGSVVLLAAGGYVINDYFDVRIDHVNNPERVILGVNIPVKLAIPFHATLTFAGTALGFLVAVKVGNYKLVFVHLIIGLLLWLYSARYKRKPLWGNLIVAFASAMVVLVVWLFEFFSMVSNVVVFTNQAELTWINHSILFLAGFAFVISLVREIVKDVEDIEGDRRYGCQTLPVLLGERYVKWIAGGLMVVLMLALIFVQSHLFAIHFALTAIYFFIIQFLILAFIHRLRKAKDAKDYGELSQLARIIMIAGVLSLQVYSMGQA